jgi:hypothetical protein
LWSLWSIVLLLSVSTHLHAQVLVVDTLANSQDTNPLIQDPSGGFQDLAQSFTMGTQPLTLSDVTLKIDRLNGGGGISVTVFSDNAGVPGSSLQILSGPSDPLPGQPSGTTGNVDYTGNLSLSPSTTYWIEVRTSNGNNSGYAWWETLTPSNAGSGTLGAWAVGGNGMTPYWHNNGTTRAMLLSVTAVPEPSQGALVVGLALVSFLIIMHRRRCSQIRGPLISSRGSRNCRCPRPASRLRQSTDHLAEANLRKAGNCVGCSIVPLTFNT